MQGIQEQTARLSLGGLLVFSIIRKLINLYKGSQKSAKFAEEGNDSGSGPQMWRMSTRRVSSSQRLGPRRFSRS